MPRPFVGRGFAALVPSNAAAAPALDHDLCGLSFLLGHWASGRRKVADTGGTSTGSSAITYADGTHISHYTSAEVTPGRSVVFTTAPHQGAPVFRLAYTVTTPTTLALSSSIIPPGGSAPHPIATGTLEKVH
jgi:hypothetical protein